MAAATSARLKPPRFSRSRSRASIVLCSTWTPENALFSFDISGCETAGISSRVSVDSPHCGSYTQFRNPVYTVSHREIHIFGRCRMSLLPSVLRTAAIAAALVLIALPAGAQFSAAIQGVVSDNSSALIPGATVTVTNVATGVSREVVTGAEGLYRVLSLGAGTYRVVAQMQGFQSVQRDQVEVGISDTVRVDFTLPLGQMSERVTVEARASQVETEQGRISGRVDQSQLKDLPLNGRNLYNLIALQPGIVGKGVSAALGAGGSGNDPYSGEANPVAYASGQRTEANSFTVDDSSVNSAARGGITNLTPNADSVEEVRVVANNFSAVDGRNSGAQVQVITKSGTNTFHGGVSYYFQNNTLASHSVFESKVPVFRRNQFAYNLGGPIIRNRTFFFTSFEGLRQSGARGAVSTVETPQFRDWVKQTHPNSIAATLLQQYAPLTDPSYNFNTSAGAPRAGAGGAAGGHARAGQRRFRTGQLPRRQPVHRACGPRTAARQGPALRESVPHHVIDSERRHPARFQPPHRRADMVRQPDPHSHVRAEHAERDALQHHAAGWPSALCRITSTCPPSASPAIRGSAPTRTRRAGIRPTSTSRTCFPGSALPTPSSSAGRSGAAGPIRRTPATTFPRSAFPPCSISPMTTRCRRRARWTRAPGCPPPT